MLVCALVLSSLVLLGYWSAPQNSFHFDDRLNIVDQPAVHMNEFSFAHLRQAAEHAHIGSRPLPSITFAIDWWRGGGEPGPFIRTNVAIHILATLASFALLVLIFRHCGFAFYPAIFAAAAGAAIWATHPVQVQAVTFVVQRMTSMAALFVLLSMICYLKARTGQRGRAVWWTLCLLAIWAGALSKENAWMAPAFLLLLEFGVVRHGKDLFQNKRLDLILLSLPLAAGVLVLVDVASGIGPFSRFLGGYEHRDFTLWERVLTQPRVIAFHLSQILWPIPERFSIAHDFVTSTALLTPPTTLLAIVAVIAWVGIGIWMMALQNYRVLGFFLLFLPIALIPESSIIPLEMVFEHRMYLPSFALAGLLGCLCLKFLGRSGPSRYVTVTVSTTVVAVLLALSTQTAVARWKDDYSLWSHALVHAPLDPRAHDELSYALWRLDRIDEAIEHASRSVELDPTFINGLHNLGRLVKIKGDRARAYELFNRALQLAPNFGPAHFSLGMLYLESGYFADARREFELTLVYDPYNREARRFLEYSTKAMQQGPAKSH
jgi:hypothetical protein